MASKWSTTWPIMGLLSKGCITLLMFDCILVPLPAASTIAYFINLPPILIRVHISQMDIQAQFFHIFPSLFL